MNRKMFIGSIAAFLAAGTMAYPKPKFDKEAFKTYVLDFLQRNLYSNVSDEKVREHVEAYLKPFQESGAVYEYKIVDCSRDNNELDYKIGIKTEPSPKFKIFQCAVVKSM